MEMYRALKQAFRVSCIGMVMLTTAYAQDCRDELAQARSMIEVLRASRDQSEHLLSQMYSRLQQALRELEALKHKPADESSTPQDQPK
jgi:hypothetical protein